MKAVSYHAPGGVEVLEYSDLPDPEPGALDVVVGVEACALNRLDAVQRHGWYQLPGFTYPHIAGMDVAGTVVSIGERRHRRRGRRSGSWSTRRWPASPRAPSSPAAATSTTSSA